MSCVVALLLVPWLGYRAASADRDSNPDVRLTTPQIIRRHGYPSESHVIETEDGYLLTLHRIPRGKDGFRPEKRRKIAFLQHGLLSSSSDWILNGPDRSLGYILADAGYDVWMGNARGNTYSRAHGNMTETDRKFWDFTWHEMAVFDLAAEIDFVLGKANRSSLYYVGHSMGTTMFFALTSTMPEYGSKVRAMVALAPVAFMKHMKSPIRLLAPWAHDIEFLIRYLGDGEFLPNNLLVKLFSKYGCESEHWKKEICKNIIFVLCGFDESQFNMTMLPLVMAHSPAGTSMKTVVHYTQEINSGKFQQFNYGKKENLARYGQLEPPEYNLSLVEAPVALFYGDNDWLASPVDVLELYSRLRRKIGKFPVPYKGFNHIDFLWGIDVKKLVYNKVLKVLNGA